MLERINFLIKIDTFSTALLKASVRWLCRFKNHQKLSTATTPLLSTCRLCFMHKVIQFYLQTVGFWELFLQVMILTWKKIGLLFGRLQLLLQTSSPAARQSYPLRHIGQSTKLRSPASSSNPASNLEERSGENELQSQIKEILSDKVRFQQKNLHDFKHRTFTEKELWSTSWMGEDTNLRACIRVPISTLPATPACCKHIASISFCSSSLSKAHRQTSGYFSLHNNKISTMTFNLERTRLFINQLYICETATMLKELIMKLGTFLQLHDATH